MVEDHNKDGIEVYSLYSLDELDNLELATEELKELLYSSKTKSKGRVFKIITVDINIGRKGLYGCTLTREHGWEGV